MIWHSILLFRIPFEFEAGTLNFSNFCGAIFLPDIFKAEYNLRRVGDKVEMATCPDLSQNLGKPQVDGADHEYTMAYL